MSSPGVLAEEGIEMVAINLPQDKDHQPVIYATFKANSSTSTFYLLIKCLEFYIQNMSGNFTSFHYPRIPPEQKSD